MTSCISCSASFYYVTAKCSIDLWLTEGKHGWFCGNIMGFNKMADQNLGLGDDQIVTSMGRARG